MSPSSHFEKTTAPNGLTIMKVPRGGTEAVTVEFLFRAGSRYETPETNGLAHFNEHMVFKGSQNFPTFRDVNDTLSRVGAVNNAFTSAEVTGFWAKVPAEHISVPLDVLSDMLTAPLYDEAELQRERGVIVEEINMYEDDPGSVAAILLEETMYPNHPLGRSTLGPKENIKSFPRQAFVDYAKEHHTPDRGLLILSGNLSALDEERLQECVARFSGASAVAPEPAKIDQTKPRLKVRNRKTEQTHLTLGLHAPSLQDQEKGIVLDVLAMVLGGGMSSRLFVEVREHQGLAYYVGAAADQSVDTGMLYIKAGVTNEKAPDAVSAILRELEKLRDEEVSSDELQMATESLKGRLAFRWEDSTRLGDYYGIDELLLGRTLPTDELLRKISAVTAGDIKQLAREIIQENRLNLAVVGPHTDAKFKELLHF